MKSQSVVLQYRAVKVVSLSPVMPKVSVKPLSEEMIAEPLEA